ncbi:MULTISPECIES: LysR family transcriptional regulator [unclassified Halomonas]|uniref:LysR family transcriptional regulator n=1 Tax=unclassified Halomonas TaxID=2609666 RepID=UPI0007D9A320|nr:MULTISPECIES: LysR family transcriptional regulator [unclassified Halomonas]MBT2785795.1 LysR family transcriptional regulator [Halomonas sp. ISL-106]MBT2798849.1 LysR family transcriptional regulator [Halomonas sp. ISL-104]OAL59209.1 LysR family transcriptional regulator [Halomonas sp. ALS9]
MNQLEHIVAFVRVAELGSYTQAAEALDISRTRVSRQVMALEEALGARLIQRTTRRLHLTEAGERYLARAQGVLLALDEAAAEVGQGTSDVRGRLRVNGPMSFGTRYLAPLVAQFMQTHPALEVRLDLNDRRVDLLEEGYDVAIRIGSLPDSSLVARRLTRCRLLFCASPEYLATYGEPSSVKALAEHRCLRYRSGQQSADWQIDTQSLAVSGPLESNNGDVLTHAAEAGLGIAQQPSFLVTESIASGRLVPILINEPPVRLDVHALYPARRYLPAKVERFIDLLTDAWGDPPVWEQNIGLSPISQQ